MSQHPGPDDPTDAPPAASGTPPAGEAWGDEEIPLDEADPSCPPSSRTADELNRSRTGAAAPEQVEGGDPPAGPATGDGPAAAAQTPAARAGEEPESVEPDAIVDVAVEVGPVEQELARAQREVYSDRIELYEHELEMEESRARAALLEHEIGDQLERIAKDEGGAVKAYARSLSSDPMLRPNLWAVRRIFYRRKLWPSLLKLLDAETRYASSDTERAELWTERGHVHEDCLGDLNEAINCYQAAHRLDPGALPPLGALEKVFARQRDEVSLIEVYRAQAAATQEPGRRVALLFDLARIEEAQATALGVAESEAAADETGTPLDRSLSYLHAAYETGVDQLRVVDEIIRITAAHERTTECLAALDVKAELLELSAEQASPQRRRSLVDEIVAVRRWQAALAQQRLGDPQLVWQYLQLGNAHSPGDPLILHDLIEVAESTGRWTDLEALLGLLAERRLQARPDRPPLGLMLWRAQALRLAGRDVEAEELEHKVRVAAPLHLPFLVQRERRALRREELNTLGALYREEADMARRGVLLRAGEPPRTDLLWAASALLRAGSCYLRAGEYGPALAAFEEALGHCQQVQAGGDAALGPLGPAQAAAAARLVTGALELAYERMERPSELAALCERELRAGASGLRAERLRETLCELYAERLGDPRRALAENQELARLHPEDLRLRLRAVELLRRAGDTRGEAEALRELDQLELRLGPGQRRIDGMLRRAELLMELGDEARATALYEEVLRYRPGEPQALGPLELLLRRAGRYEHLGRLLRSQADACAAGAAGDRLLVLQVKLAELHERDLGQPEQAAAIYRDVLIQRPGYLPALRALARLYRRIGDAQRLASLLELLVEAVPAGQARADALLQLAEVYEDQLGRPAEAEDAYQRALGAPGGAPPAPETAAHAALGRLRTLAQRRAQELPEAVLGLEPGLGPGERAHLTEERAALLPLQRDKEAEDLLLAAQDALRAHCPPEAYLPLPELGLWQRAAYRGDGARQGAAVADLADRVSDGDVAMAAGLWLRAGLLGLLYHEDAPGRAETWRRLAQAYRLQPTSPTVLATLGEAVLATPAEELPPLAVTALQALRAQEDPRIDPGDRLLWALTEAEAHLLAAARAAPDDPAGPAARLRAANAALAALEIDPHAIWALWLLRRATAPALGAPPEALRTYALYTLRLGSELREPGAKVALYQEAADLLRAAGDLDTAAAALRAVLDIHPEDPRAFGQAYELLMARAQPPEAGGQGDPGPLLELLDSRLAYEPADEALRAAEIPLRVALLLQRSALRQAAADDNAAIADLRALLQLDPGHQIARRRLADLLAQVGQIEAALAEYEQLLRLASDAAERRGVHLQMATLIGEADAARASAHLGQAIALGPRELSPAEWDSGTEAALYRWQVRLLLQIGDYAEAVAVLRQLGALVPPGPEQGIQLARVELEISDVLQGHAQDPTGALRAVGRALLADPLSLEALDRMVSLCTELGETDQQTKLLYRAMDEARGQAAAQKPPALSAEPYHALAQIYSWLRRWDAHHLAVQAECAVNGTPPRGERPPRLPRKALAPVLASRAFGDDARGVLLDLWRDLWESLSKLLAPELTALGANPKERLNAKALPPAWAPLDQLAQLFGLGPQLPYGLYLSRERELCQLSGANLVCGPAYATPPTQLQPRLYVRLLLRLALLPDRLGCVASASGDELLLAVAAACRVGELRGPEIGPALGGRLDDQVRALSRHMSRRERKALAALAPRLEALAGAAGRARVLEWQQAVRMGAARLALALSGSVAATLDEAGVSPRAEDLESARAAQTLLRFAVSAEIQDLRYELGVDDQEGKRAAG